MIPLDESAKHEMLRAVKALDYIPKPVSQFIRWLERASVEPISPDVIEAVQEALEKRR